MKYVYLIYTFLSTLFILTLQKGPVTFFQPLQRETRFTKFDFQFKNKSTGTVYDCSFKQISSKHVLFFHVLVNEIINQLHATFSVSKCKEYYVDCVNVISYDVCDLCSKLELLSHFMTLGSSKETLTSCPIVGEFHYKNMKIDADKFGSIFSIPTERWWEYYWKIKVSVYNEKKVEFGVSNLEFYFIQYRNRNRKH